MSGLDKKPTANRCLNGQVAVVTGAGRGIGRAIALEVARAGADVAVNDLPESQTLQSVVQECQALGVRSMAMPADLGDRQQVEDGINQVVEQLGGLDVAISNAAYSDRELFHEADLSGFERTIQVTMWGPFYLVRAAARHMIAQKRGGSIVIVSSTHATRPIPGAMAYNMSKAAVEQMAKTAATELTEHRIRVNALRPGWVDTPGERKFFTEENLENLGSGLPMGRLGKPEEIAHGAVFLCDPASESINGSVLTMDGGIQLPVEQMFRLKQQPSSSTPADKT
ncbi:MAG: SDR family oxidoreductase [Planctomycetota bacterium]|nr:SDR family oxidoreductase [Planctomycetota bacterium]